MWFSGFFFLFVCHSWSVPMMKITGLSHLFKGETLHNCWLTKYFFAPLYFLKEYTFIIIPRKPFHRSPNWSKLINTSTFTFNLYILYTFYRHSLFSLFYNSYFMHTFQWFPSLVPNLLVLSCQNRIVIIKHRSWQGSTIRSRTRLTWLLEIISSDIDPTTVREDGHWRGTQRILQIGLMHPRKLPEG